MASIRKDIAVEVGADFAWSVLRQVDQAHKAFAPVLTDCRMEGDARIVTFAGGLVAKELIVDVDDAAKRLVYAVVDGAPTHHNAAFQVFAEGDGRCRIVWITDVLPHSFLELAGPLTEAGSATLKRNLERQAAGAG
ncbi:MAG: SRPBCC family protein [Phenylobacterium sp.]|uniref:SRPBCC family protein n=1 Tax=Phenylobacterium sp. TaxID=1871053 RepID=UPI002737230B|nr:SRPBCC family protein [Phenylobacterium sp.]MDP3745491.1 SRPBCC family protein [Phenylobacterium sp.]